MSKRILNMLSIACTLATLLSCNEKHRIECRIDGLWEIQLSSQEDYSYWYDSCAFMNEIFFFDIDKHVCSLPDVEEPLTERAKENYKGYWEINKMDSQWVMTIIPRKHPLQGDFSISFYKDTIHDSHNHEKINYYMKMENEEWNIVCKKSGIILSEW